MTKAENMTGDERTWYEWGRLDWRDLGRHCGSIQRGEVRQDLAQAYKAGYRAKRDEMAKA